VSPRVAASGARRNYVSETKPASATVNVDSTIKAEQKAFLKETGTRPQDAIMPTTGMSADVMMSPTAGTPPFCSYFFRHADETRAS
jgi:cysteine desulfurase